MEKAAHLLFVKMMLAEFFVFLISGCSMDNKIKCLLKKSLTN